MSACSVEGGERSWVSEEHDRAVTLGSVLLCRFNRDLWHCFRAEDLEVLC